MRRPLRRLLKLCSSNNQSTNPSQQELIQAFNNELPNHLTSTSLTVPYFRTNFRLLTKCWKQNKSIDRLVHRTLTRARRKVEEDYRHDPKRIEELLYIEALKFFVILKWWHDIPPDVKRRLQYTFHLFIKLTSGYIQSLPAPPDSPILMLEHMFVPIKTEC